MTLASAATIAVAMLHVGFFVLESLLWMSPAVMRIFGNTTESASATRILALNQGFYNLGAAALLLTFLATGDMTGVKGMLFFIFAMGVVGAVTANWRIFLIQSLPALLAVGLYVWT